MTNNDRLLDILRRHIRTEDSELTDRAFALAVLERYLAADAQYLIDPNE